MKKTLIKTFLMAACVVLSTNANAVQSSKTLDVNVNVVEACSFSTTSITFPDYNNIEDDIAYGDVTVTCPQNSPYNIAMDAGLHFNGFQRQMLGSDNVITYSLWDDDQGIVWGDSNFANTYSDGPAVYDVGSGSPQSHAVKGLILAIENVPPGAYSDTVTVTLYW